MKTIKVFEMFAGYGGASFGLKKAGIDFECMGISEVDKYAIQCHSQNHKGKNYGDCSKIDPQELSDFDLLTGGFPCQDVSIAGNRDLSKGRTNLYLEILRIAEAKKPKYILLENVKGLLSVEINERKLVHKIVADLQKIGYGVVWKVLNSKDYGTPQNRERIWIVCKFGGWDFMEFMFPNKEELKIKLKDVLEKEVDKKYYLSQKQIDKIIERNLNFNMKGNRFIEDSKECFSGLTCNQNHNDILVLDLYNKKIKNDGISICLTEPHHNNLRICKVKSHSLFPRSGDPKKGGTGHLSKEDGTSYCLDTGNAQCIEVSPCLTTELAHSTGKDWNAERFKKVTGEFRRLTPKECFRLMGFFDDKINLEELSDTQCYRLAGNGWDINLVSKIFKKMFK